MSNIIKIIFIITLFISPMSCTKNKTQIVTLAKPAVSEQKQNIQSSEEERLNDTKDDVHHEISVKVESPRLPAVLKSENTSSIGFQTSGVISKINVKSGNVVKKDQPLAVLDSTMQSFDLENAKIDLESKKTLLQQTEKKYTSYLSLFKSGTLSKNAFEEEENNFKLAKLNYESAEINLKTKKHALKLTQLEAPFDGVIVKSYKSLGDFVAPGVSVFDLVQTNDLSVFSQVPLALFGKIKTGMIFSILNPLNGQSARMTVQTVVPVIDTQSHTFDIYGKIEQLNHNFFPGMYVEIILK